MNTITSSAFNRDSGAAKRASADGVVIITDRGTPSHVLMTYDEYQRLTTKQRTIGEALAMPEAADIEFDPTPLNIALEPATFD